MGHPHVDLVADTLEQDIDMRSGGGVAGDGQDGVTVLLAITGADITTVVPGDLLKTVADAEDGDLRTPSISCSAETFDAGL
jgi:hypothetical protein